MPARPAMAIKWIIALVEPPIAISTAVALSKAASVMISRGFKSSHTISTIRRPQAEAIKACAVSTAGIEEAPGRVIPRASDSAIMVAAVPITIQVPAERDMPPTTFSIFSSSIRPARRSAQ